MYNTVYLYNQIYSHFIREELKTYICHFVVADLCLASHGDNLVYVIIHTVDMYSAV